jgi:Tol biopolymer transport system component
VVDYNPCWNNNGTEIIFHRERWNSADNCDIMKINVSGTGLTNLTNASTSVYNYDPSYSPDGSNIVYVRESPSSTQLRLMDSNGAQFAGNPLLDSFWPGTPRFSPNGALIAFIDSDLYVTTTTGLNPDTGVAGAKKISTSGWVTDYCWSPDSGRIVYSDGFVLHQANVMGSVSERQVSPIESTEDWIPSWGQ